MGAGAEAGVGAGAAAVASSVELRLDIATRNSVYASFAIQVKAAFSANKSSFEAVAAACRT